METICLRRVRHFLIYVFFLYVVANILAYAYCKVKNIDFNSDLKLSMTVIYLCLIKTCVSGMIVLVTCIQRKLKKIGRTLLYTGFTMIILIATVLLTVGLLVTYGNPTGEYRKETRIYLLSTNCTLMFVEIAMIINNILIHIKTKRGEFNLKSTVETNAWPVSESTNTNQLRETEEEIEMVEIEESDEQGKDVEKKSSFGTQMMPRHNVGEQEVSFGIQMIPMKGMATTQSSLGNTLFYLKIKVMFFNKDHLVHCGNLKRTRIH